MCRLVDRPRTGRKAMLSEAPILQQDCTDSGDAGFTLIEALVTLAILALALSALVGLVSDSFANMRHADTVAQASLHARSLLDKVGTEIPLKGGELQGELPNGMRWRLNVEPFGDLADQRTWPIRPVTITAQVLWQGSGRENSLMISTLRLGPRESSP